MKNKIFYYYIYSIRGGVKLLKYRGQTQNESRSYKKKYGEYNQFYNTMTVYSKLY